MFVSYMRLFNSKYLSRIVKINKQHCNTNGCYYAQRCVCTLKKFRHVLCIYFLAPLAFLPSKMKNNDKNKDKSQTLLPTSFTMKFECYIFLISYIFKIFKHCVYSVTDYDLVREFNHI